MTALTSSSRAGGGWRRRRSATARTVISTIVSRPAEVREDHRDDVAAVRLRRARDAARPRRRPPGVGRESAAQIDGERADARRRRRRRTLRRRGRAAARRRRRRGVRQAREDADEDEREDRLDQDRDERDVRRADHRVHARRARSRAPTAPAPAAAGRGRGRRSTPRRRQSTSRTTIGRSPTLTDPDVVGAFGRRDANPSADQHARRDEHGGDAVAQVAHLGVVEPVRAAG